MKNSDKIDFIFQTGRRVRMHLEHEVFSHAEAENSFLSGLSAVQMKIAIQIHQSEPVSLSELADHLGLSHPSASVMVEKLVEKEIVSRETDPDDRRRIQLRIHPGAAAQMNALHDRFQKAFTGLVRKVGNENIERWYQVAARLNEVIAEENS